MDNRIHLFCTALVEQLQALVAQGRIEAWMVRRGRHAVQWEMEDERCVIRHETTLLTIELSTLSPTMLAGVEAGATVLQLKGGC